jgi:hypothetical protein
MVVYLARLVVLYSRVVAMSHQVHATRKSLPTLIGGQTKTEFPLGIAYIMQKAYTTRVAYYAPEESLIPDLIALFEKMLYQLDQKDILPALILRTSAVYMDK